MEDLTRFEKITLAVVLLIFLSLVSFLEYERRVNLAHIDTTNLRQAQASIETKKLTININTASQGTLELLPGVGPVLAKSIIDYRQKNGPFKTKEELSRIKGIGKKKLQAIIGKITLQ